MLTAKRIHLQFRDILEEKEKGNNSEGFFYALTNKTIILKESSKIQ